MCRAGAGVWWSIYIVSCMTHGTRRNSFDVLCRPFPAAAPSLLVAPPPWRRPPLLTCSCDQTTGNGAVRSCARASDGPAPPLQRDLRSCPGIILASLPLVVAPRAPPSESDFRVRCARCICWVWGDDAGAARRRCSASVSAMKEILRGVLDAELTGQSYQVRAVLRTRERTDARRDHPAAPDRLTGARSCAPPFSARAPRPTPDRHGADADEVDRRQRPQQAQG